MPLPLPEQHQDWQSWAAALLQVLSGGAADSSDSFQGATTGLAPRGYATLLVNEDTGKMYSGNDFGTPPPPADSFDVDTLNIAEAAVETSKVQDSAVVTAKLADAAVENPKVGAAAVLALNLGDAAVEQPKLADAAVDTVKLAAAAVETVNLLDAAVLSSKVADGEIVSAKIASAAINNSHMQDEAVSAGKVAIDAMSVMGIVQLTDGGSLAAYTVAVWSDWDTAVSGTSGTFEGSHSATTGGIGVLP